ncbi:MAG: decarboxylating 6-phosphogluconate dehydrogenase [Candidatus Latescibacteria bacterium]|nr:decarboxylating 6-phosphogluconate dehydrogenase [Candidatus Latescibacterota bacterium]
MQLSMIGLGRMGGNMVRRLMKGGHRVVVFDRNPETVKQYAAEGAQPATSLEDLTGKLSKPRVAWVMVPAGAPTDDTVNTLAGLMDKGDIIIDGGNSMFKDDVRRSKALKAQGLNYVDVGTSGGIWGITRGYCMMIGGEKDVVEHLDPIFKTLAPGPDPGVTPTTPAEAGYIHAGPAGAGHFVKMIHNGIEYGLMQSYAEGFEIFRQAASEKVAEDYRYNFNLHDIAEAWRHGSVVSSWLLDLLEIALRKDQSLVDYTGFVQDSGEGRWTIQAAIEEDVPANVLTASLYTRFRSREKESYAEKILSALRHQFGGHLERPTGG